MSEADDELARAARNVRRRKRRRKSPVAVVPLVQSEAGPPRPGKLEQPPFKPGLGQFLEEEVGDPLRPSAPKSRSVDVAIRVRHYEVLSWFARERGVSLERAASEVLGGALAGMQRQFRRARTGKAGGSVLRSEMPEILGA